MLIFLSVTFLLIGSNHALQCVTNCSIGPFEFHTTLHSDDEKCQQRVCASKCSLNLEFLYHTKRYKATFEHNTGSRDFIYITMKPYLSYDVKYSCSKNSNCALAYAQNRITDMSNRAYNVAHIHKQLAPLIENSTKSDSIQCYNMKHTIVQCAPKEVCNVDYNPRDRKARERGCKYFSDPIVMVYDSETYSSFDITCNRNLCNGDATLSEVKAILFEHGLTDGNGRRIAAGTMGIASVLLMLATLTFTAAFYL
ncbi:hypothetical protein I4U23_003567 [Adineta vaga]|nr:hypothetical protein I4U23_003567 [Adineta vaga]